MSIDKNLAEQMKLETRKAKDVWRFLLRRAFET
jgi:hypothetical protein